MIFFSVCHQMNLLIRILCKSQSWTQNAKSWRELLSAIKWTYWLQYYVSNSLGHRMQNHVWEFLCAIQWTCALQYHVLTVLDTECKTMSERYCLPSRELIDYKTLYVTVLNRKQTLVWLRGFFLFLFIFYILTPSARIGYNNKHI